jgi:predicted sugar kinase
MGAAAAVGLFGGGMLVLSGNAAVVARMPVPETHCFVIATTRLGQNSDAATQLSEDIRTYEELRRFSTSARFEIAYDVLNSMLPAMLVGNLREIGEVIVRHRLSDNQIQRYKTRYPQLAPIPAILRNLFRERNADVVSISSTGPTAFALTTRPEQVREILRVCNLVDVLVVSPNNIGATHIVTVP